MGFRTLVKSFLFKRGYHLLRRYYYDFEGNKSIVKIFKMAQIDLDSLIILDVGANIGQSVDRFRGFSDKAQIYSFEPNPEVFQKLIEKAEKDKYLKCFNIGVGSQETTLKFNIQPDSGASSFYKVNTNGEAFKLSNTKEALKNHNKTTLKQDVKNNTEIEVTVRTLDSVFMDEMPGLIHLLKIDTQGYEEEVLRGASSILRRTLIVEAEVIFSDAYEKSSSLHGIQSILEVHGFVLWDIPYIGKFPDENFDRINFIDGLFVNLKLLNSI